MHGEGKVPPTRRASAVSRPAQRAFLHESPIEQIRKSIVRNEDLASHSRLLKNESEEEKRDFPAALLRRHLSPSRVSVYSGQRESIGDHN